MFRIFLFSFFIIFNVSSFSRLVRAQSPSALSILKAGQKIMYVMEDQSSHLTFRIIDAEGNENKTVFQLYWKNYGGQDEMNSKTLLITESPIEDKGKKFLVWEYLEESQVDQWIYLPELRQVRRVLPNHQHHDGKMASDLLVDDVRRRRFENDQQTLLPDEEVEGEPCNVIENRPIKDNPYGRMVMYFSKKDDTLRKVAYFSETGDLLKTQWITWETIDGIFVWKRSEIVDAHTGQKTLLELSDTKVNSGLQDHQFSNRALRR